MIFSTLISTLSVEALPHVIGLSTSREVWLTLETLFSAQSQSRIMQLKQQLATLKKGVLSISAYYQKAQGFSQLLAAVGKPMEASELVSIILVGLGLEYDPLVTSMTTCQDLISLSELYGFMLSYEMRLKQHKSAIDLNISTANTTQRQSPSYISGIATPISLVAGGVVVVDDHLSNILFLVLDRPNVLSVKCVTSKATRLPPASSGASKDIRLTLLQ
jgi:hypothetical protein